MSITRFFLMPNSEDNNSVGPWIMPVERDVAAAAETDREFAQLAVIAHRAADCGKLGKLLQSINNLADRAQADLAIRVVIKPAKSLKLGASLSS